MAINCFYHIDKLRYVQVLLMIWWYDKMINKFDKIQKISRLWMGHLVKKIYARYKLSWVDINSGFKG